MPYRFTPDDPDLEAGLRRIATEQAESALEDIEDEDLSVPECVHSVRKRLKKLRALLRLVRPALREYGEENERLRDAGRRLADLRDGRAAVETLDRLLDVFGDRLDVAAFDALRTRLEDEAEAAEESQEALDALDAVGEDLEALLERIPHWRLEGDEGDALLGIARTVERARSAMEDAGPHDDEELHDWRKRTKYHRYHARLLSKTWPEVAVREGLAHDLTDLLGEHHDLAVFQGLLGETDVAEDARAVLAALCHVRAEELAERAFALGERLFAEKPKALHRRFAIYWEQRDVN